MNPCIRAVAETVAQHCAAQKIILFNHKADPAGNSLSFKLCVVAEAADPQRLEKELYLAIDCELPFDLLLYSPAEWENALSCAHSFAHRIEETGRVLLG